MSPNSKRLKILKRCKLDFGPTYPFIEWTLDGANALSSELLRVAPFSKGVFFTLLPEDVDLKKTYNFNEGIISPQNLKYRYRVNEEKIPYSDTRTLNAELSVFLLNRLQKDPSLSAVFDDVLRKPDDPNLDFYRQHALLHVYENQLLYVVPSKKGDEFF